MAATCTLTGSWRTAVVAGGGGALLLRSMLNVASLCSSTSSHPLLLMRTSMSIMLLCCTTRIPRRKPTTEHCRRLRCRAARAPPTRRKPAAVVRRCLLGLPPSPPLTWGQRLLELLGLVGVSHAQGVQVLAAADLELSLAPSLLDLHRPRILPARGQEELLDLLNLLGLRGRGGVEVSGAVSTLLPTVCTSFSRPNQLLTILSDLSPRQTFVKGRCTRWQATCGREISTGRRGVAAPTFLVVLSRLWQMWTAHEHFIAIHISVHPTKRVFLHQPVPDQGKRHSHTPHRR
jgi:hypothetical protein